MPRRIVVGKPVSKGFWDPWGAEEVLRQPEKESRKVCVICLSEVHEGAPTLECPYCGAIGHKNCFDDWISMKGSCPLCRRPITG